MFCVAAVAFRALSVRVTLPVSAPVACGANSMPRMQLAAGASDCPLAAQVAGIEAKVFARIYATLSRNQQSKAAQTFPLLAESVEEKEMGGRDSRGGGGR